MDFAMNAEKRKRKVTVKQVCTLAVLTVTKHRLEGRNPIGAAGLEWIFVCCCEY